MQQTRLLYLIALAVNAYNKIESLIYSRDRFNKKYLKGFLCLLISTIIFVVPPLFLWQQIIIISSKISVMKHKMAMRLFTSKFFTSEYSIARKLLIFVMLASSIFTFIFTFAQLKMLYDDGLSDMDLRLLQIEKSYSASLSKSIWDVNIEQIDSVIIGLLNQQDVASVVVYDSYVSQDSGEMLQKPLAKVGQLLTVDKIDHNFSIFKLIDNKQEKIGEIQIQLDLNRLYHDVYDQAVIILFYQGFKATLMSLFILFIFHYLVTRYLVVMADFSRNISFDNLEQPLVLPRRVGNDNDEIGSMVAALNQTKINLKQMVNAKEASLTLSAEVEQSQIKIELEQNFRQEIEDKNTSLLQVNQKMEQTLADLQNAQKQLVKSERMAAIGNMVQGVAHELNTPVGLAYTAVTHIQHDSEKLQLKIANGGLTKSALVSYLESSVSLTGSIATSLDKAAQLIKSFKLVSVNEHQEHLQQFNLCDNLDNLLASMRRSIDKKFEIINSMPKDIEIESYPGVFYQIYTNLINNSVIHGFDDLDHGTIKISAKVSAGKIIIEFSDDGLGMSKDTLSKLYEPFFTTKRARGGTGLGMNIVHTLVGEKLEGDIDIKSELGQGTTYFITLPLVDIHSVKENSNDIKKMESTESLNG